MRRYLLFWAVLILIGSIAFAQGISIREMTITRDGITRTLDDWWYSSAVDCYTETGQVDIGFCVDTSGSMAGAIDDLYMNIGSFAHRIEAMGFDARFGLLNYTNVVSFPAGRDLFDAVTFEDVLSSVSAAEGGTENHWNAIDEAHSQFHWRATSQRIIILISDECYDPSGGGSIESDLLASGTALYVIMPTTSSGFESCDWEDFEEVCISTGGQFFDYETEDLDDVLDRIADDFADFESVSIDVQNLSGETLDPIYAEISPLACITLDSPAEMSDGPIADGGMASFTWDITEIPHCNDYDDCFWITVWSGSYRDSIVGCLFIEDCGCPGPEAEIIEPPRCGFMTACEYQEIVVQFESFLQIDPSTIILRVNGTDYPITDPQMSYDPGSKQLTFTPSTPWGHDVEVTFQLTEAADISGCELIYSDDCNFFTDFEPPLPLDVTWDPPCGSAVTETDIISFSCTAYDDPAGMTVIDDLSPDDVTDITDFIGSIVAVGIRFNGIPYVGVAGLGYYTIFPHIGWPPGEMDTSSVTEISDGTSAGPFTAITDFHMINIACMSMAGYPDCGPEDWEISASFPASVAQEWALGAADIEICFDLRDLVSPDYCGPNDTSLCCTYHLPSGCVPGYAEILCPMPCGEFTSCEEQFMQFGLYDTTGASIDTMRAYFTAEVHHSSGGVDTYNIFEPSDNVYFTGSGSSVEAFVSMPWEDGDSVWISLDSFYTTAGCRTIP
ncbi:MAG: vWA domain-containing protein [Candidatus Zixiibacteriota bacterium]